MMPGTISGRVTVTKTHTREAPSVAAACSSFGSTASIDRRTARTMKGKAMTPAASAAPVQRKANVTPSASSRKPPIGPRVPKASNST